MTWFSIRPGAFPDTRPSSTELDFIRPTEARRADQQVRPRTFEPMFDQEHVTGVELPDFLRSGCSIDRLARQVQRSPHDPTWHLRRIHLARELGRNDEQHAALHDLTVALKDDDGQMKSALYAGSTLDIRNLVERLSTRDARSMDAPPGSVLPGQPVATHEFIVDRRTSLFTGSQSVAERADCLILDGQLENARDLLEQTVLDDPDDLESSEELLFLYRFTHDLESFREMLETMHRLRPSVTDSDPVWRGTESYFALVEQSTSDSGGTHA